MFDVYSEPETSLRDVIIYITENNLPMDAPCGNGTVTRGFDTCNIAAVLKHHRTKNALRLCTSFACRFFAILHENSLTYYSMPASFSYNLTKNLTAHLPHNLCVVVP